MNSPQSGMQLPADVVNWLRSIFSSCNERISFKLSDAPNIHEESLDLTFIESFSHHEAPVTLPSGWTLRFETHFLGGRRHWERWEIADIGLLVMLRTGGHSLLSKVALLQSKRLYPNEIEFEENEHYEYMIGFRRLFEQDSEWAEVVRTRAFNFNEESKYKAFFVEDAQYKAIREYEDNTGMPVYYLLYNPAKIPWTAHLPLTAGRQSPGLCEIGCRVVPAQNARSALRNAAEGSSPTYKQLYSAVPQTSLPYSESWRLEDFAVDLLLGCQTGRVARTPDDYGLTEVFYNRSGPIAAAVGITVDAPEDFRLTI